MRGQAGLVARLAESTSAGDPRLFAAFARVDRGRFVPGRIWVDDESGGYRPLERSEDEHTWSRWVYADHPVVTQVDDGRESGIGRVVTSSASQPSLVLAMLDQLDPAEGLRVLEVGAGTGYNAALLCSLLGNGNVTTVEIDQHVADSARAALDRAGFQPTVVTGDGAGGYQPDAPYDRVIATYAVRRVPYAWLAQCRPGAVIVTPWGTPYDNHGLLRLVVGSDGTASGRLAGSVNFMWDRRQRPADGLIRDIALDEHEPARSTTRTDPRDVLNQHAAFTIGLRVPDCRERTVHAPDASGRFTRWLLATDRGSWAAVSHQPGQTSWEVEQYGPRRLWDEVEAAYAWWTNTGRPERERFGVTVSPDSQWVWLDHRDSEHRWQIPR